MLAEFPPKAPAALLMLLLVVKFQYPCPNFDFSLQFLSTSTMYWHGSYCKAILALLVVVLQIVLCMLVTTNFSHLPSTWLSKPGEVGRAVEAALRAGYCHIDCAHIYGNEAEIGQAFKKCFQEGICKREDVFITSKLW